MASDADQNEEPGLVAHYLRGLQMSTKNNSMAYGYSIAATGCFAVVLRSHPRPSVVDILLFALGASAAFALINASITRGFTERFPEEPPIVVALGTALSVFSIMISLGTSILVAWLAASWIAWPLGAFAATITFVAAVGVEMAFAGWKHEAGGFSGDERRKGGR